MTMKKKRKKNNRIMMALVGTSAAAVIAGIVLIAWVIGKGSSDPDDKGKRTNGSGNGDGAVHVVEEVFKSIDDGEFSSLYTVEYDESGRCTGIIKTKDPNHEKYVLDQSGKELYPVETDYTISYSVEDGIPITKVRYPMIDISTGIIPEYTQNTISYYPSGQIKSKVKTRVPYADPYRSSEELRYDETGNLTYRRIVSQGFTTVEEYYHYEYDAYGHIIRCERRDNRNRTQTVIRSDLDEKRRVTAQYSVDENEKERLESYVDYGDDGSRIETFRNGGLWDTGSIIYGADGRPAESRTYSMTVGEIIKTEQWKYSEKDGVITETRTVNYTDGRTEEYKHSYEESTGRTVFVSYVDPDGSRKASEYRYDNEGRITGTEYLNPDGSMYKSTYEYDDNGDVVLSKKKSVRKKYVYHEINLSKEEREQAESFYLPEEVRQYIEAIDIISSQ